MGQLRGAPLARVAAACHCERVPMRRWTRAVLGRPAFWTPAPALIADDAGTARLSARPYADRHTTRELGGFAASPTADEMRTAARELSSACCSTKRCSPLRRGAWISLEGALSSVLLPKAAAVPAADRTEGARTSPRHPAQAAPRRTATLVWGGIDRIRSDGTSRVSRRRPRRRRPISARRLAHSLSPSPQLCSPVRSAALSFARTCATAIAMERPRSRCSKTARTRTCASHCLALSHADTNCLDHRFACGRLSRGLTTGCPRPLPLSPSFISCALLGPQRRRPGADRRRASSVHSGKPDSSAGSTTEDDDDDAADEKVDWRIETFEMSLLGGRPNCFEASKSSFSCRPRRPLGNHPLSSNAGPACDSRVFSAPKALSGSAA